MRRTLRLLLIVTVVGVAVPTLSAQEYFGAFLDTLKGIFLVYAKPRPLFKLESDFRFTDPNDLLWSTPAGTEVDGASIPQPFWSFIGGPFEGQYINASVIHDHYCKVKSRTEHDTHRNFYYGMRAAGVSEWKAKFMYWAVATFGPKWKLERRIDLKQSCQGVDGRVLFCETIPEVRNEVTASASVDFGDPDTLAAALSKAAAVARSLRTTDGKVLDVSVSGQVPGSLDDIARSADSYRAVFISKDFTSNPDRLGILSQWTGGDLDQVKPWENNRLPQMNDAVLLRTETVDKIETGKQFKLDPSSKDLLHDRIDLKSLKSSTQLGF
jgi:hypothetical protein